MYFLLSGEGPTDIGAGKRQTDICHGDDFLPGPMAVFVDRLVFDKLKYSILESGCGFVAEEIVSKTAKGKENGSKYPTKLSGKKSGKETSYFFKNAYALGIIAGKYATQLHTEVIAVLFRDCDGTASAGRGEWSKKWQSMIDGFESAHFTGGVPMIPKPKSEAWLLCAMKDNPYQNCEILEDRSGNDRSPNNLKAELSLYVNGDISRETLVAEAQKFDLDKLKMRSFNEFRGRLVELNVAKLEQKIQQ